MAKQPTVLMIVNGFGLSDSEEGNAFRMAKTPALDNLMQSCPCVRGLSGGMAVGLPDRQPGNSEVGHVNIGAGRIVYQQLSMINKDIEDGSFFRNPVLQTAIDHCRHRDSALHICGLLSEGGIHSHISHLYALLELAKRAELRRVYVHCFLDGRDVPGHSGAGYVAQLQKHMRELGVGEIATISGRFYAMDRDNNYDRIKMAYAAMTKGDGMKAANASEAVSLAYDRDETDEYVTPTVIVNGGVPVATVNDDDALIFFNFREDRARELTRAFCDEDFRSFKRDKKPDVLFVCFTDYDPRIEDKLVVYEKDNLSNTFGDWIAANHLRQIRIGETECYGQLTYFFNGGSEEYNPEEERIFIKSPKVMSYDQKPEMSANEVCEQLLKAIRADKYDVIIADFVNPDLVGHTGNLPAVIKAVETVDSCVGRVVEAIRDSGGVLFLCSDHGNAERCRSQENGEEFCAHTMNPVPFILFNYDPAYTLKEGGCLADVVPTLIEIMGRKKPAEMTGKSLLIPVNPPDPDTVPNS